MRAGDGQGSSGAPAPTVRILRLASFSFSSDKLTRSDPLQLHDLDAVWLGQGKRVVKPEAPVSANALP